MILRLSNFGLVQNFSTERERVLPSTDIYLSFSAWQSVLRYSIKSSFVCVKGLSH